MSRDRFHDLHHENAPYTQHIRLISEGGSSLARSPGPICIDSIQVSQTCTMESQHTVYRSATGACALFSSPDTSLFSVPSEFAQELDQGLVPTLLRIRLTQQGLPLGEGAQVDVKIAGSIWFICDQERKYPVRKLASHLTIYRDAP